MQKLSIVKRLSIKNEKQKYYQNPLTKHNSKWYYNNNLIII